jgi:hypothetical protein
MESSKRPRGATVGGVCLNYEFELFFVFDVYLWLFKPQRLKLQVKK